VFVLKRSWFTKLENVKLAQKIIIFMKENPNTYKAEIARACLVSKQRLDRLAEEGYLFLPKNKRRSTHKEKL
jgi:hypothetical protein